MYKFLPIIFYYCIYNAEEIIWIMSSDNMSKTSTISSDNRNNLADDGYCLQSDKCIEIEHFKLL